MTGERTFGGDCSRSTAHCSVSICLICRSNQLIAALRSWKSSARNRAVQQRASPDTARLTCTRSPWVRPSTAIGETGFGTGCAAESPVACWSGAERVRNGSEAVRFGHGDSDGATRWRPSKLNGWRVALCAKLRTRESRSEVRPRPCPSHSPRKTSRNVSRETTPPGDEAAPSTRRTERCPCRSGLLTENVSLRRKSTSRAAGHRVEAPTRHADEQGRNVRPKKRTRTPRVPTRPNAENHACAVGSRVLGTKQIDRGAASEGFAPANSLGAAVPAKQSRKTSAETRRSERQTSGPLGRPCRPMVGTWWAKPDSRMANVRNGSHDLTDSEEYR